MPEARTVNVDEFRGSRCMQGSLRFALARSNSGQDFDVEEVRLRVGVWIGVVIGVQFVQCFGWLGDGYAWIREWSLIPLSPTHECRRILWRVWPLKVSGVVLDATDEATTKHIYGNVFETLSRGHQKIAVQGFVAD